MHFGVGSKEGAQLKRSLFDTRPGAVAEFDSYFAITTTMDRIGKKVDELPPGVRVTDESWRSIFDLAQSHAHGRTWAHYVMESYGQHDPNLENALVAFFEKHVRDTGRIAVMGDWPDVMLKKQCECGLHNFAILTQAGEDIKEIAIDSNLGSCSAG